MATNEIFNNTTPYYIQLYERLRDELIRGVHPYGKRFPSKRVLADRFGLSLVTVEHSLELLVDEGYLESKERSGYFVSFREKDIFLPEGYPQTSPSSVSHEEKQSLPSKGELSGQVRANGQDIRKSNTVLSLDPVYGRIQKAMRRVMAEYGEKLLERVPGQGVEKLREVIRDYLARSRGIYIDTDQLVIGAGSEYLYGLIVQLFGKDTIYGIENPSYIKIEKVYRSLGAELELLELGNDGILSSSLNASHAGLLHISPYRSFPSGISTNASKRREYVRWADSRNAFIIEDDFESEFSTSSKPEETVFSLSKNNNVLYLNSFTRTISPSLRISYLILPKPLVAKYREKLGFYACTVPGFEQYVLADFIESGEFERHINRVRRKLREIH